MKSRLEKRNNKRDNAAMNTTYNMGGYEMAVIDDLRMKAHQLYLQSYGNFQSLVLCYELLTQMFLPFKYITHRKLRGKMDGMFTKFEDKIHMHITQSDTKKSISTTEFYELRKDLRDIFDLLYYIMNKVGLSIPHEKRTDPEDRLDEQMGVTNERRRGESSKTKGQ